MATQDEKSASDLREQAIGLAEQLGRIAGMIEGTAERGRKAATTAVRNVRRAKAKTAKPAPVAATRKADPSRAPGKRRRKPAPSMKGVKKSDERIPKMRTAAAARQRRKSYA